MFLMGNKAYFWCLFEGMLLYPGVIDDFITGIPNKLLK